LKKKIRGGEIAQENGRIKINYGKGLTGRKGVCKDTVNGGGYYIEGKGNSHGGCGVGRVEMWGSADEPL
jgi:hypothetical protein